MHLVETVLLECESGHEFYLPLKQKDSKEDEELNLSNVECPICGDYISSEASRTILVAVTGADTIKLLNEYGK